MPDSLLPPDSSRAHSRSDPLDPDFMRTYIWLRIAIAAIAIMLPPLVWLGGRFQGLPLRSSISAYYYATPFCQTPCCTSGSDTPKPTGTMRNEFVGLLFAVGALLLVYKGYTAREDWALNAAGVLALGVALFHPDWSCVSTHTRFSPHGTCAVLFFLMLAYVSAFCSKATVPLLPRAKQKKYLAAYRGLATLMVLSPVGAYIFNLATGRTHFIFLAELFGVYAFAAYWIVKLTEINYIGERRARREAEPRNVGMFSKLIQPGTQAPPA